MGFLSQANLDVSHTLFAPLNWSAPRSGSTSLLFDVQLKWKKYFFPKQESKATSISEFEKKWDHYNYGLKKIANRFGRLKF